MRNHERKFYDMYTYVTLHDNAHIHIHVYTTRHYMIMRTYINYAATDKREQCSEPC